MAVLCDGGTVVVRGMGTRVVVGVVVVSFIVLLMGMMGMGAVVSVRWMKNALTYRVIIVQRLRTPVEHPRMDNLVMSSVSSSSGIIVRRMTAIVSRIIQWLNGVGVLVVTFIERRRIARGGYSSVSGSLGSTSSASASARSPSSGVATCSGVRCVMTTLAVRGVLMIRDLTCRDIGRARSGARRRSTTHGCEEWTHVRG